MNERSASQRLLPRLRSAVLIIAAAAAMHGCEDGAVQREQPETAAPEATPAPHDPAAEGLIWKDRILDAAERTGRLRDHRFEGEIRYPQGGQGPGVLAWSGTSVREPLRMSGEIRIGKDDDTWTVPVYLTEDAFYLSIPTVNLPGEYLAASASSGFPPLEAAGGKDLALSVLERAEPQWIRSAGDETPGNGDGTGREDDPAAAEMVIRVTEENKERLEEAFRSGLAEWSGNVPDWFALLHQGSVPDNLRLQPGGTLSFAIDEQGLLVSRSMELAFGDENGQQSFAYTYRILDPNAGAAVPDVPERVLPLEHVLAFLREGI